MKLKIELTRDEAVTLLEYLWQERSDDYLLESAISKVRVALRDKLTPGWFEKVLADPEDQP